MGLSWLTKRMKGLLLVFAILGTVISGIGLPPAQAATVAPFTYTFEEITNPGPGIQSGTKEIVVEFYDNIQAVGDTLTGAQLANFSVTFPAALVVDPEIDSNNKLHIQVKDLDPSLENYTITIAAGTLVFDNYSQLDPYTINFNIKDINPGFKQTFIDNTTADPVNEMFYAGNTSEDIKLFVPKRYITAVSVLHKAGAGNTPTLTSIDVECATEVSKVKISILNSGNPEVGLGNVDRDLDKTGTKFSTGWAGLDGAADGRHELLVKAYDASGMFMESARFRLGVVGDDNSFLKNDYIDASQTALFNTSYTLKQILEHDPGVKAVLNSLNAADLNRLQVYYPKKSNIRDAGTANELSILLSNKSPLVDTINITSDMAVSQQVAAIRNMRLNGNSHIFTGNLKLGLNSSTHLNISLRNITITGNLTIDAGDFGTVRMQNVTIGAGGSIIVLSGGVSSIYMDNVTAPRLRAVNDTGAVRIVLTGTSNIITTSLEGTQNVTLVNRAAALGGTVGFGSITVANTVDNVTITLDEGSFGTLTLATGAIGNTINIPTAATLTRLVTNNQAITVAGSYGSVDNAACVTQQSAPGGSGGSTPGTTTATLALTGTLISNPTEKQVQGGNSTLVLTLSEGARWNTTIASDPSKVTCGLTAVGSLWTGAILVRNSDTRVTLTLPAAGFSITSDTNVAVDPTAMLAAGAFSGDPTVTASAGFTIANSEDVSSVTLAVSCVIGNTNAFLNGTTAGMEYSNNTTDGINGNWHACIATTTAITVVQGQGVGVRQSNQTSNYQFFGVMYANSAWISTQGEIATALGTAGVQRIMLEKDIDLTGALLFNTNKMIDLNGNILTLGNNTITMSADGAKLVNGFITLNGTGNIVVQKANTLKNLDFIVTGAANAVPITIAANSGNVTLNDINLSNPGSNNHEIITAAAASTSGATAISLTDSVLTQASHNSILLAANTNITVSQSGNTFTKDANKESVDFIPELLSVQLSQESTAPASLPANVIAGRALNYIKFTYSEPVILDHDGSTGGFVNVLTANGTTKTASAATYGGFASTTAIDDFGSFAGAAAVNPNAAKTNNIMVQSADGKSIFIYVNAAAFNPVGLTTGPSGVFDPTNNHIYDSSGNQLSVSIKPTALNLSGGWDLTKPLLSSVTDSNTANNTKDNGSINFAFNEKVGFIDGTTGTVITAPSLAQLNIALAISGHTIADAAVVAGTGGTTITATGNWTAATTIAEGDAVAPPQAGAVMVSDLAGNAIAVSNAANGGNIANADMDATHDTVVDI